MSGRDFGRGGRGGFGDRDNRGGGGGFRDREGGNFRDRGNRDAGAPPSRPWERRDGDERPARPAGDRPFDRPGGDRPMDRPAGPPPNRVERFADVPSRPPRDDRFGDRPSRAEERFNRFGPPRDATSRATTPAAPPAPAAAPEPAAPAARNAEPKGAAAAAARPKPQGWTQAHLMDSWLEETRLKGWTPSDRDQQEMVEDNIEADPQVPGRDHRAISVQARSGKVTLTGVVRSRAVKFAAGSDAYWTFGVLDVMNELEVRPRGPQSASAAPTETAAPVANMPKRVSKAAATAAEVVGVENVVDATLTPEEVAAPENAAANTPTSSAEEPASGLDEANATPEEVSVSENQAAPDMIESDEDDEA